MVTLPHARDPEVRPHRLMPRDRESLMDEKPGAAAPSDFAAAERSEPLTPEEQQEELLEGDFAGGERTLPLTEEEKLEAGLHGDFAGGERTIPLTPADDVPGSFAPDEK